MSGQQAFDQFVEFSEQSAKIRDPINQGDYEQWKHDYIWEALHGIRYGQSFCNHFDITDNILYHAPGDIAWCDKYIRKHYVARKNSSS